MKNNIPSYRYLKNAEIDAEKWESCINNAGNSRIYACYWHLERTCDSWDALVWGDYEYVMPLPIRKKMGIKYIYQPLFSQQLGIFPSPPKEVLKSFYVHLNSTYKYVDFQLNSGNVPEDILCKEEVHPRDNYLLPLIEDYASIAASFSKNTKRNIAKAAKNNLSLTEGIRLEEYLDFKMKNLPPNVEKSALTALKSLIAYCQYKGLGEISGIYTDENQLCAAVFFCKWKNRVIYYNAASNAQSKKLGGMYFLVAKFIEKYAENNLILDFEGSMIPGVARFYRGFGAGRETYFQLKYNHLPLFLRWIKR